MNGKISFWCLSIFTVTMSAFGNDLSSQYYLVESRSFDFAAPIVSGTGSVADKQVGMIVYDASNDSFKGLDRSGNWDTLAQANASQVTSSASGVKVEYAAMSSVCSVNGACTLNSNRSSSNITITRTALGTYTVNLLNSIFTYAPVCTATMEYQTGLSGWTLSTNSTSSSTAFYLSFGYWTGTTLGSADGQIDVVCVGR